MERATRRQIMEKLRSMNITFDEEATVIQLRELYQLNILNQLENVAEPQQQTLQIQQQQQQDELVQQQQNQPQQQPLQMQQQQQPDELLQQQQNQPQQQTLQIQQQQQQEHLIQLQQVQPQQQTFQIQQLQLQEQQEQVSQQQQQVQLLPQLPQSQSQQQVLQLPQPNVTAVNISYEEAELNKLISIEKKKLELKRLQAEVNEISNRGIDIGVLDAMVPKFDGSHVQNINKWVNDLEHTFQIFRYNNRDKLVAARHLLQGHAKKFVEILSITSYDELKQALLTEFGRTFTMQDVFKMLKSRSIKPGETVRQYIVEMQCIASRAEVPEADLLDFIIEGINDQTPNGAMLYSATSLQELKFLLDRYERKRSVSNQMRTKINYSSTTRQSNVDMSTVRCYNCFRYGHYQGACTAPKREQMACFICNKVGHHKHQCPQRNSQNATARITAAIANMDDEKLNQLAEQLSNKNIVSIAFIKQGEYIGNLNISALFDSGSPISFVCRSCIPFRVTGDAYLPKFRGVGNKRLSTYGVVRCKIIFKQQEEYHKFYVLPDKEAVVPVLIGQDLLKKFKIFLCKFKIKQKYNQSELKRLNKVNNKAELSKNVKNVLAEFELLRSSTWVKIDNGKTKEENINVVVDSDSIVEEVQKDRYIIEADEKFNIGQQLGSTEVNKLYEIIQNEYLNVYDKSKKFKECSMKIKLMDKTPIFSTPRRLSIREKMEVQQTIDRLLQEGIIRPSDSPYASPIVLVRKKDGELRMCVDYRAVNKVIVRDRYPLPVMEDCLAAMGGKRIFSLLDLKSSFHQVPVEEESKYITAFVTPMGQYEYNYVPFGIVNSPPVFQRFITRVLQKIITKGNVIAYLDDICIATKTVEKHYEILSEVLKLLAEAGLELNLKKCKFGYDTIRYLGYNVNKDGISLCDEHITSIKYYPIPTNVKEVQRCIGLFSYFRRFVRDFSKIARPLSKLLYKENKFQWEDEQMKAFLELKKALIEAPVL